MSIQLLVGASVGIVVVSILCNQYSGESYEKLHESFVEVKVLNMCSNFYNVIYASIKLIFVEVKVLCILF